MSDTPAFKRPDLPKRFYVEVAVAEAEEGGFTVLLDGRSLRTPLRRRPSVPTRALAASLAAEWTAQGERIDPATMPLTRLVNTVVDGVADDPASVKADLAGYIETDMLFYRAGYPERLVARQGEMWDPIVGWAEQLLSVRFLLAEGVMHVAQAPAAGEAFKARLAALADPFAVAALHQMTTLTGSAILALAVAEGRLSVEEAWAAAHVDEDWNIGLWGSDAEAEARRAARLADMRVAAGMLAAVTGADLAG